MAAFIRCWNKECANDTLSPRAVHCPICKTDRPRGDYGKKRQTELSEAAQAAQRAIESARQSGHPNSFDLTEQQWYNVCRFFPTVAARCSRPLPDIGPHNPLHATSRLGMLAGSVRSVERMRERQPGEDDE